MPFEVRIYVDIVYAFLIVVVEVLHHVEDYRVHFRAEVVHPAPQVLSHSVRVCILRFPDVEGCGVALVCGCVPEFGVVCTIHRCVSNRLPRSLDLSRRKR